MNTFQLKQFNIIQEKTPMKVGTDAMILGSWTDVQNAESILDIGTGTGILALMLAQRSEAFTIDAIEIDPNAYEEAVENFENSPWGDRLFCYHASLQEFAEEMDEPYDLIICNPPYFQPNKITSFTGRKTARETHLLNHLTLLKNTKKLLSSNGTCAFSLPFESEKFFVELATQMGFILQRILRMKDTENVEFVRSFLQFGFEEKTRQEDILVLKNDDKTYSEAYQKLTKEFHTIF